uniref:Integrase core domain containing protein n=1 Tax=Solanum tuberosum TaxID=4113 RepID=M1E0N4_SOLTU
MSPNGRELDGFSGQSEKPEVAEGTRRRAESLLDRPLSAPLNPSYTITFGGKGKGKRSTYNRKTTIRDANVPSWAWGFCAAVHVSLDDSHMTSPSGSSTAILPKVIPSTDAQTQSDASGTDSQMDGATV